MRNFVLLGVAAAAFIAGCGEVKDMDSAHLILDAKLGGWQQMFHVTVVDDPFGGTGKALKGGPGGSECINKTTFVNNAGFFTLPTSQPSQAELHLFVGVRKERDLKVEVWARHDNRSSGQKIRVAAPVADAWQELVLPLDPAKFPPGCTIYDLTVFQLGQDKTAELFVRNAIIRYHRAG